MRDAARLAWLAAVAGAVLTLPGGAAIVAIDLAPRRGPDGSSGSSDLATVVYSSPANTIVFMLLPAAGLLLLAAAARWGGRTQASGDRRSEAGRYGT
jgi:hypothetical protein